MITSQKPGSAGSFSQLGSAGAFIPHLLKRIALVVDGVSVSVSVRLRDGNHT